MTLKLTFLKQKTVTPWGRLWQFGCRT